MSNYEELESSKRQMHEDYQHEAKMMVLVQQIEFNLFSILKPTLTVDGNQWCCLYGKDLQDGIAGFGDSPYLAILDWNKEWHNKIQQGGGAR